MNGQIKEHSLGLLALGDIGVKLTRELTRTGKFPDQLQIPVTKKTKRDKKKTLIVGWDAADWDVIKPMLERGQLPALNSLIGKGVMGNIRTLDPPFSPMLWTSIATGKHADQHGILNFVEPQPDTGKIRPVQSTSRKCRTFWNILGYLGYKTNIVGWWPSHPAEPVNGVMVSNHFHKTEKEEIPEGSVFPISMYEELKALRVAPSELDRRHAEAFIRNLGGIKMDEEKTEEKTNFHNDLLNRLAIQIAHSTTIQATTTHLMQHTDWDVTGVYFEGIDRLSHLFMKYHPPRQPHINETHYHYYKRIVTAAYRFHDMMLGRLLELAGEDTTVILLSDHGFYSDHRRLPSIPNEPAGIAHEHNPMGVFCMKGPGIKQDQLVHGASLLDVTPTLLAHLGEAIGEDMEGKVLQTAFDTPLSLKKIPSWEDVDGEFYEHLPAVRDSPLETKESLQDLVDLGYLEALAEDEEEQLFQVTKECNYNLALVLASKGRYEEAIDLLETIYEEDLSDHRINKRLIDYYCITDNVNKARNVFSNFKKYGMKVKQDEFEALELRILAATDDLVATEAKTEALLAKHRSPGLLHYRATNLMKLLRYEEATNIYLELIQLNPQDISATSGLGRSYFKQNVFDKAAEYALSAINMEFFNPNAHYQLGMALFKLAQYEDAARAFEIAIHQRPNFNRATSKLIRIFRDHLEQPKKAEPYVEMLRHFNQEEIVVVSGLPRSGTSMMMQILDAGGLRVLTDGERTADKHNPKGYWEYTPVKNTLRDKDWLEEAGGKAVKVVAPLLHAIPLKYKCKVIFMERDLDHVLHSQQKMLADMRGESVVSFPLSKKNRLLKQSLSAKEKAHNRSNLEMMSFNYQEILKSPDEAIEALSSFLNFPLDTEAAKAIIAPELNHS
jgi:predicted AlkP superfamily phosphohydrolase/phosphomutase/tetratricopeptide (TPR) repeat protein